jgi:pantetheine-phosphate adenylyltransferase
MNKAIYPGSFDPITLGHTDIIHRIAPLYEELIVVVASSQHKSYLFNVEERTQLIRESLTDLKNVRIENTAGLIVDFARAQGAKVMVRGLRAIADFEYESAMANMNKNLAPDLETLIVFTDPKYSYVASRMVKEVAFHGGDLRSLVPQNVIDALKRKFQKGSSDALETHAKS